MVVRLGALNFVAVVVVMVLPRVLICEQNRPGTVHSRFSLISFRTISCP